MAATGASPGLAAAAVKSTMLVLSCCACCCPACWGCCTCCCSSRRRSSSRAADAARDASAAAATPPPCPPLLPGLGPGPAKSGTRLAFTLSGSRLRRMASCSCASSSSGTSRAGERLPGGLRAAGRWQGITAKSFGSVGVMALAWCGSVCHNMLLLHMSHVFHTGQHSNCTQQWPMA